MSNDVKARACELARSAEAVIRAEHDVAAAEPFFLAVAGLADDKSRAILVEALLDLLRCQSGPLELVEYCAHELRWTELRTGLEELLRQTSDRRSYQAVERILEAFNDEWDQRDIYARWASGTRRE